MGYHKEDMFEEHIKTAQNYEHLISNLRQCSREDRVKDFVIDLLEILADSTNERELVNAAFSAIGDRFYPCEHTHFAVIGDKYHGYLVVGELPENWKVAIKKSKEEG